MNEVQWRELQQIRDEQNRLTDRLARLESRLRSLESIDGVEAAAPAVPTVTMPPPPPLPTPVVPPEAYVFSPPPLPAEIPPPLPEPSRAASSENAPQAAAPRESLEVRIGTTWLVRVGVVMVLTALAFLGSYLYKNVVPHLGPALKVGLLYLGAGALAGAGAWLEKGKEAARAPRMLQFARVVLAGGLAAVYYVTYAAHWNPNLVVLRSSLVDGLLLVAWTAFMVWLADRRGSEVLATFSVLLAYYASAINEIAAFTLLSNLLLAAGAVYLLGRHLWRVFPYATLLASFGSYAFWHYHNGVLSPGSWEDAGSARHTSAFWIHAGFLSIYWLLFTWAVFVPREVNWTPRRRAGFAALNNGALFVLITWSMSRWYPGDFWKWSLGFGVTLCALAETCRRVRTRVDAETEGVYFLQGLVFITLGFFACLDGWQLGLVLAAQSVVLFGRAQVRAERLPLWGSLASAVAAFVVAANQLADWRSALPWPSAAGVGALLVFNAWWSQHRLGKSSPAAASAEMWPDYQATLAAAPAFFSALGLGVWLWLIERMFAREFALVPVLAVAAAVLSASFYVLRIRAVPFYALVFLLNAYVHRFNADDLTAPFCSGTPAWSMATLFGVTLALGHWWQYQWPWTNERSRPPLHVSGVCASLIAVLAVVLLYDWLRPAAGSGLAADVWVAENAALSLALLAYGLWTRYRSLAAAGQALLFVSVVGCVARVWWAHPAGNSSWEMMLTLVPLAVLLATIFAGRRYVVGASVAALLPVYEAVATLFLLVWAGEYLPAETRFAFFCISGAIVAAWSQVRREPRWLWWGGAFTVVGLIALASLRGDDRAALVHLCGIAAIAAQQQFVRFWTKREPAAAPLAPPQWHAASMAAATFSAWTILNAWVMRSSEAAFTLAASWSIFAGLIFVSGLALHEKVYRWLGLAILVCALGRIAVVEIWQLDGLGRAISALCLGVVLLGIGYLYNRFHAKWHGLF